MKNLCLTATLVYIVIAVFGQVGINGTGASPHASAALDIDFPDKGLLVPRMSQSVRDTIINPSFGLIIYNTSTNCLNMWSGASWKVSCFDCLVAPPVIGGGGTICEGGTLNLTASNIAGATYSWMGPDAFSSTQQNPTVSTNATTSMSGTYSVVATLPDGCTTDPSTAAVVVNAGPDAPTASSHTPAQDQIMWQWNAVSGATGYKWNTTNDYGTATDNGTTTTYTQTGLSCNTFYTLYVWSYGACGNSAATSLTAVTLSCPSGSQTFTVNGSGRNGTIQTFTVPSGVTSITIEAWGAQGGDGGSYAGGLGARMKGNFSVSPGQELKVLVGQKGGSVPIWYGGGGGGSFVSDNSNNPMLVAGGGGGGTGIYAMAGGHGLTTTAGGNSPSSSGGTGGSGGGATIGSAGGGGFSGNGGTTTCGSTPGGLSFINGGTGGDSAQSHPDGGLGGFGGGGGGDGICSGAGGGGGGYSGGAGAKAGEASGGGGSYNGGSNQDNSSGVNSGDGQVIISW